jgi:hypothetical protein
VSMNLNLDRAFLKRPGVAGRMLRCPAAQIGKNSGRTARHLRWALAIVSRFGRQLGRQRDGFGIHSQGMTLAHGLGPRVFRSQTILHSLRVETRLFTTGVTRIKVIDAMQGSRPPATRLPLAPSPTMTVPSKNAALASQLQQAAPHAVTLVATEFRSRMVQFVDKIAVPRISLRWAGNASTPGQLPLIHTDGPTRPTSTLAVLDRGQALSQEVLMQKHRRIEERPFLRPRETGSKMAPALDKEQPARIHGASTRLRVENHPTAETARPRGATSMAPSVNVAQITDAVLQQLDRRLVAARERMGRS